MTIPKQLQAHSRFADCIQDENGRPVIFVSDDDVNVDQMKEIREEIIYRWNAYETLRDTLKAAIYVASERELEKQ